jgi:glutamyl aminopeptidase
VVKAISIICLFLQGFARFMDSVYKEWEMESYFVGNDLLPVLVLDRQESSHPIVQEVSNPNQIAELFDRISYSKGSLVIRMLENFMGRETFRRGMTQFLKKYSFNNAVTDDLWTELQSAAGPYTSYNIPLVMDTWTRQMGYPVLTPHKQKDGSWILSQEKFMEKGNVPSSSKNSPFGYKWEIPISFEWTSHDSNSFLMRNDGRLFWMRHDQKYSETLPITGDVKWLKLNKGQFGYYRVNYGPKMYEVLKRDLLSMWTATERCGALDDVFALAFASYLDYNVTLDFIQVLKNEEHFFPWDCSNKNINWIGKLLNTISPDGYAMYRVSFILNFRKITQIYAL